MKALMILHCECGHYYYLKYSKFEHIRERLLKYAICPVCEEPRDKTAWLETITRCAMCKCPIRKGYSLCHAHYVAEWKERKRIKSLLEAVFID